MTFSWRWTVFTLLVFSGLIKLGLWQSDRAVEKEQRLTRIAALVGQQGQPLDTLLNMLSGEDELNDQPVKLSGYFLPDLVLLHDNQPNNGQLGYRVYQSFEHITENQQQLLVLVNLGWVIGTKLRSELPDIKPLSGKYDLAGHIRFIEPGVVLAEENIESVSSPLRVQQVEIDKLSRLIDKQLLPFAVYLDKNESTGYEKNWQPVVMPPEKHRGYAFQWFSLATAWLILMVCAAIKHNKNNKAK